MTKPLDPALDWLADAPLTLEQRKVWNQLRADLVDAREKIAALDERLKLLQREGTEDQPQSILTRPEFNREVARMLAFDERYGGTSSVLYFDFENLDEIAAHYGKAVANAAVQDISHLFQKHVRGSDIIGRLAADEFGVLLVRCNNDDAWKKGKLLAGHLAEQLTEVHGCKIDLVINYGAYTFRESEEVGKGLKEAAQMMTKGGR